MMEPQAFGRCNRPVQRIGVALLGAGLIGVTAYLVAIGYHVLTGAAGGEAVHIDFTAFWAAAKLAVAGEPAAAYDFMRLELEQRVAPGDWAPYYWLYPPTFQMMLTPLGTVGFVPAFVIWTALSLSLYGLATARISPEGAPWAVAAAPVVMAVMSGSFGILWVAGFAAALLCLERDRPWLAAAAIAFLAVKPQLGLMIPVALIAGRHWRVVALTILCLAAMILFTIAVWGTGPWLAFIEALSGSGRGYADGSTNGAIMMTWYAFALSLGLTHEGGMIAQGIASVAAAVAVGWIWSRPCAFAVKAAALSFATLAATPYGYLYELALMLVGGLFLLRHGIGRSVAGGIWLAAIWGFALPFYVLGIEIAHYAAPGIALCLAGTMLLAGGDAVALNRRLLAVR